MTRPVPHRPRHRYWRLWAAAREGWYSSRCQARTVAYTGEPLYGGDFLNAGLNSTRGQAALSAASVLFATQQITSMP